MSLFATPEQHAANPPSTWKAVKTGGCWSLATQGGAILEGNFDRKRDAEDRRLSGNAAALYEQERRWYAGERVDNWKSYAECLAERAIRRTR